MLAAVGEFVLGLSHHVVGQWIARGWVEWAASRKVEWPLLSRSVPLEFHDSHDGMDMHRQPVVLTFSRAVSMMGVSLVCGARVGLVNYPVPTSGSRAILRLPNTLHCNMANLMSRLCDEGCGNMTAARALKSPCGAILARSCRIVPFRERNQALLGGSITS